ncbi:hypothetical protein ADICEAN_03383 [Cesiribacter andamanensis AMV16]|uniref:Uncharacterized protein n=1 Tax=Cesiribacter andamanensis AMV16 TaxID=1279009 RepID=M7MYH0_9BACT|nr:hypothetical protein ADICEAN_03383 [Cesiribacter andamanensis AMV16]
MQKNGVLPTYKEKNVPEQRHSRKKALMLQHSLFYRQILRKKQGSMATAVERFYSCLGFWPTAAR